MKLITKGKIYKLDIFLHFKFFVLLIFYNRPLVNIARFFFKGHNISGDGYQCLYL